MFKWAHPPGVPRPGQCYLCSKRPGTEFYRSFWVCKRCLFLTDVKDGIAIVIMLGAIVALGWVVLTFTPLRKTVHLPTLTLPQASKSH